MTLLTVRFLLFGNPFVWAVYDRWLGTEDLGWRQRDVVGYEKGRRVRQARGMRWLAVGSSQAGALFGPAAKEDDRLFTFTLAGMGPLDYYLYRDFIARFEPEEVLLYLSDFDLAREPSLSAARMAPVQGAGWPALLRVFAAHRFTSSADGSVAELLAADLLPEFKYGFVLRALTDKWFGAREALAALGEAPPDREAEERIQMDRLRTALREENIPLQLDLLRLFLDDCRKRGFRVILVEGDYNPKGYTAKNRRLAARVAKELEDLAAGRPGVRFIPRSTLPPLGEEDYRDGYHLRPEPARARVDSLLRLL